MTERNPASVAGPTGQGKPRTTVLVIDDDDIARALITEILRPHFRVVELNSPIGATRTAIAEGADVVVLDVQMPNIRGDMLAKLFRNNARLRHVGVVLVSGCAMAELSELGKTCGADAVVAKRELRQVLVHTVTRICVHCLKRPNAQQTPASGMRDELDVTGTGRSKP